MKEEIQGIIEAYFEQLFQSTSTNGSLSQHEKVQCVIKEENEGLISAITPEKLKATVFSMHPDKESGMDGLNPMFFQTFWNIVGNDIVMLCQCFMQTCELPSGINRTIVCLLPKIKIPQLMTNLRPISLCNVVVRILSKVLSNRLKPCLNNFISDK